MIDEMMESNACVETVRTVAHTSILTEIPIEVLAENPVKDHILIITRSMQSVQQQAADPHLPINAAVD